VIDSWLDEITEFWDKQPPEMQQYLLKDLERQATLYHTASEVRSSAFWKDLVLANSQGLLADDYGYGGPPSIFDALTELSKKPTPEYPLDLSVTLPTCGVWHPSMGDQLAFYRKATV
jgi:hypothetical protein